MDHEVPTEKVVLSEVKHDTYSILRGRSFLGTISNNRNKFTYFPKIKNIGGVVMFRTKSEQFRFFTTLLLVGIRVDCPKLPTLQYSCRKLGLSQKHTLRIHLVSIANAERAPKTE